MKTHYKISIDYENGEATAESAIAHIEAECQGNELLKADILKDLAYEFQNAYDRARDDFHKSFRKRASQ